jgi:hypothetical protein
MLLKKDRIQKAIKELVKDGRYDEMIDRGFRQILQDPEHKFFQATCDKIFRLRGDYSPEKSMSLSLTPDDVAKERASLVEELKQLRGKREQIARGTKIEEYGERAVLGVGRRKEVVGEGKRRSGETISIETGGGKAEHPSGIVKPREEET